MERLNCVVIEDNILEFLDEIEQQLGKGIICCKCQNPCENNSRCKISMKNLLTDIQMFKKAYSERNPKEEKEEEITPKEEVMQQVVEKTVEKQILND